MNTAPPVPEVATTLTAAQLRQQWQEDEEVRQWGRDQEADEAMRRRIRQDQEWQELRQRQEEQAYQDQIRRNLRAQGWRERQPAYHQQWTVRRAEAEAMQLQQGSQALDKVLQQMQQQQQEMLYRRQQEILNRQYR
jgi:hypothetical protein